MLTAFSSFQRLMLWLIAAELAIGALAFVPSPFAIAAWFDAVPEVVVAKAPALVLKAMPEVESYDSITARPLFNPDRVPDPLVPAAGVVSTGGTALGDLSQYRVVGIAGDGVTNIALIRKDGGAVVRVKSGDSLDGWVVGQISERGVAISGGGRKEILTIPKAKNSAATP